MSATKDDNLRNNVLHMDPSRSEELLKQFEQEMGFPLLDGHWSDESRNSRPASPDLSVNSVGSETQSPVLRSWRSNDCETETAKLSNT